MDRLEAARLRVVTLEGMTVQKKQVNKAFKKCKKAVLAPNSAKKPPLFTTAQLARFTDQSVTQIDNRLRRPGNTLPEGTKVGGTRRYFSVQDVQAWMRALRPDSHKPRGADAIVLVSANLKGGVSKTTTAKCLADGLSLRGYRILVIDLDPQASMSTFLGMSPETSVTAEQTLYDLFTGEQASVEYAIQQTYWPGIDVVPCNTKFEGAAFMVSSRQGRENNFEFWSILDKGLVQARKDYDIIIIDTPPALTFTSVNGLLAADALIMPLPPKAIDFAASTQFWELLEELLMHCRAPGSPGKQFAFIDVLLSMVDSSDSATSIVREWIHGAYGEKVLPVEIPKASAASNASKDFGSVYDLMAPGTAEERNPASTASFKRAFDAYEKLVAVIEERVQDCWMLKTAEEAA